MGTPTSLQNVDERGYVFVTEAADCQIVARKTTIGTAATQFPQDAGFVPVNLPGRRIVFVKNNEASATIHIGGADVTTAHGFPLAAGQILLLEVTDGLQLYGIAAANSDLRSLELA